MSKQPISVEFLDAINDAIFVVTRKPPPSSNGSGSKNSRPGKPAPPLPERGG